jgi:uncharacterized protein YkwD
MLAQVSQAMPHFEQSAPQQPTDNYAPTYDFQLPPFSSEESNYQQINEFYNPNEESFSFFKGPKSQSVNGNRYPSTKPEQGIQKENTQSQKESSKNEKYPGSNENFNPQVVLDMTNEFRKQNGKKPLELRTELVQDAYSHSKYMESIKDLTHDRLPEDDMRKSLERKGLKVGGTGENIAQGALTDKDVYNAWSTSKTGHKEIMLGDYDYMGVAISGAYSAQTFAAKA